MLPALPLRLRDEAMVLHFAGIDHRPVHGQSGGRGVLVTRGGGRGMALSVGGGSSMSRAGGRGQRGVSGGRRTVF
jgi:hypothetical protein